METTAQPIVQPTKKPAKKKSSETGVWFMVVDHHWGTRGLRSTSNYFFRSKPTPTRVKEIACGEHYTLTRKQCGKSYSSTSYH